METIISVLYILDVNDDAGQIKYNYRLSHRRNLLYRKGTRRKFENIELLIDGHVESGPNSIAVHSGEY